MKHYIFIFRKKFYRLITQKGKLIFILLMLPVIEGYTDTLTLGESHHLAEENFPIIRQNKFYQQVYVKQVTSRKWWKFLLVNLEWKISICPGKEQRSL